MNNYTLRIKVHEGFKSLEDKYMEKILTKNDEDSGFDLLIPEDLTIKPGSFKINHCVRCEMVHIRNQFGIAMQTENVPYMMVPRSSISKTRLICHNSIGIIDKGYRGTLGGAVINIGSTGQIIKKYDRLFQIVLFNGEPFNIDIVSELSESNRGESGFGSTGR